MKRLWNRNFANSITGLASTVGQDINCALFMVLKKEQFGCMEKSSRRHEFVNGGGKEDFRVSEKGIDFKIEQTYPQRGGLVLVCIGAVQSVGLERKGTA